MEQNPCGVFANMIRACGKTTPRRGIGARCIKMQNQAQLILELLRKPPSRKPMQDGSDHPFPLALANPAML